MAAALRVLMHTHTYEELSQELFTLTERQRQQQQQKIKKKIVSIQMTTLWNALNAIYISILSTDFRFNSLFFRSLSHVSECQLWCIEFVLSRSAGISHLVTHTIREHSRNSSHDHVFRI